MTLVPALAEAQAARIERMKRMGMFKPAVVVIQPVAPKVETFKPLPLVKKAHRQRHSGGFLWTDKEVETLREMAAQQFSAAAVARKLKRSIDSVQAKAYTIGVKIFRRPSREFMTAARGDDITKRYKLVVNQDLSSKIRVRGIIQICADRHGIPPDDILADSRDAPTILARQQAMWLAAKETTLSLAEIGRQFKRDHTTIIHGVRCENDRSGQNVRGLGGRKR